MAAATFSTQNLNDEKVNIRWTDEIIVKNKKLQEENDVLSSQNQFWKNEVQKKSVKIEELNAFLSDIESETEIKSMMGNFFLLNYS